MQTLKQGPKIACRDDALKYSTKERCVQLMAGTLASPQTVSSLQDSSHLTHLLQATQTTRRKRQRHKKVSYAKTSSSAAGTLMNNSSADSLFSDLPNKHGTNIRDRVRQLSDRAEKLLHIRQTKTTIAINNKSKNITPSADVSSSSGLPLHDYSTAAITSHQPSDEAAVSAITHDAVEITVDDLDEIFQSNLNDIVAIVMTPDAISDGEEKSSEKNADDRPPDHSYSDITDDEQRTNEHASDSSSLDRPEDSAEQLQQLRTNEVILIPSSDHQTKSATCSVTTKATAAAAATTTTTRVVTFAPTERNTILELKQQIIQLQKLNMSLQERCYLLEKSLWSSRQHAMKLQAAVDNEMKLRKKMSTDILEMNTLKSQIERLRDEKEWVFDRLGEETTFNNSTCQRSASVVAPTTSSVTSTVANSFIVPTTPTRRSKHSNVVHEKIRFDYTKKVLRRMCKMRANLRHHSSSIAVIECGIMHSHDLYYLIDTNNTSASCGMKRQMQCNEIILPPSPSMMSSVFLETTSLATSLVQFFYHLLYRVGSVLHKGTPEQNADLRHEIRHAIFMIDDSKHPLLHLVLHEISKEFRLLKKSPSVSPPAVVHRYTSRNGSCSSSTVAVHDSQHPHRHYSSTIPSSSYIGSLPTSPVLSPAACCYNNSSTLRRSCTSYIGYTECSADPKLRSDRSFFGSLISHLPT
jgi:hypothetical protein